MLRSCSPDVEPSVCLVCIDVVYAGYLSVSIRAMRSRSTLRMPGMDLRAWMARLVAGKMKVSGNSTFTNVLFEEIASNCRI